MNNHNQAISIIKSLTGQANVLTIPRVFVDFMFSLDGALFLSQVIYWSDKGKDNEGWFYKSYDEWTSEICLSKYEVSKHSKRLQEMGLLETKLKKANGAPTVHYRFLFDEFVKSFVKFLDNRMSTNLTMESEETERSLTETTTETTTVGKTYTPQQIAFGYLAKICKIDLNLMLDKQEGQLGKEASKLIKAGVDPPEILQFGKWWYANDWRGKKSQPPLPTQVRECWGQFRENGKRVVISAK